LHLPVCTNTNKFNLGRAHYSTCCMSDGPFMNLVCSKILLGNAHRIKQYPSALC
jgi:hypothetical protein